MSLDDILSLPGVLIGSRGLDVATEDSDYDFAILKKDLPEDVAIVFNSGRYDFGLRKYFNYIPLGNAWLIPKWSVRGITKVDFIVFEDDKDLTVLETVLNELKQLPKFYLENKSCRVQLFEAGLKHYGFQESNPINESPAMAYPI